MIICERARVARKNLLPETSKDKRAENLRRAKHNSRPPPGLLRLTYTVWADYKQVAMRTIR